MEKNLEKYVEFFLVSGKEGNVPGNGLRPSELITGVTQPVSCTSTQCMSNMERLKPQGIPWRWQKLPGNWSYANKGKGSAIF